MAGCETVLKYKHLKNGVINRGTGSWFKGVKEKIQNAQTDTGTAKHV